MINLRTYGSKPYSVAVIHGGPGALGSVATLAIELSKYYGVLEPLQTKTDLEGQIDELKEIIESNCEGAIDLIGHSWGAWLAYIFTAKYTKLVKKLIMVGSGPFEEKYVEELGENRLSRMTADEQAEFNKLLKELHLEDTQEKDKKLSRLVDIVNRTDNYEVIDIKDDHYMIKVDGKMYQKVWNKAAEMRKSGELVKLSKFIECEVLAIQGDYDPHPAEGVKNPLKDRLKKFKLVLLKKCGHYPWKEKYAFEDFYREVNEFING